MNNIDALPAELAVSALNQELLVSIRTKLVQLIDSTRFTIDMIGSGGNQALLPWSEIVSRYTLLLAQTRAITSQLVPPPPPSLSGEAAEKAWKRTLAQTVVHPVAAIEKDKEFIVGTLLRTKQDLELENATNALVQNLPPDFQSFPPTLPNSETQHDMLAVHSRLQTVRNLIEEHDTVCAAAYRHANEIRTGNYEDEDDDNEFYTWNMRLEEEDNAGKAPEGLHELVNFMRTGVVPVATV